MYCKWWCVPLCQFEMQWWPLKGVVTSSLKDTWNWSLRALCTLFVLFKLILSSTFPHHSGWFISSFTSLQCLHFLFCCSSFHHFSQCEVKFFSLILTGCCFFANAVSQKPVKIFTKQLNLLIHDGYFLDSCITSRALLAVVSICLSRATINL